MNVNNKSRVKTASSTRITTNPVLDSIFTELGYTEGSKASLIYLEVHLRSIGLVPESINRTHLSELVKLLMDEGVNLHPLKADLALVSIPNDSVPYPVLTARGYARLYKQKQGKLLVKPMYCGDHFANNDLSTCVTPENIIIDSKREIEGFIAVYKENDSDLTLSSSISTDEINDILNRFHKCSLPASQIGTGLAFNRLFKVNRTFKMNPSTVKFNEWFNQARAQIKTTYRKH
jgi:hypothetical protein